MDGDLRVRHRRAHRRRVIRQSGRDEAETHFAIQRAACVDAFPDIFPPEEYPFPDDAIRERWRHATGTVLVAERDGRVVGVAWSKSAGCTASMSFRSGGERTSAASCTQPPSTRCPTVRSFASGCSTETGARGASTRSTAGGRTERRASSSTRRIRSTSGTPISEKSREAEAQAGAGARAARRRRCPSFGAG